MRKLWSIYWSPESLSLLYFLAQFIALTIAVPKSLVIRARKSHQSHSSSNPSRALCLSSVQQCGPWKVWELETLLIHILQSLLSSTTAHPSWHQDSFPRGDIIPAGNQRQPSVLCRPSRGLHAADAGWERVCKGTRRSRGSRGLVRHDVSLTRSPSLPQREQRI